MLLRQIKDELLAVVHTMKSWRPYLRGVNSTVVTDHQPDTFLTTPIVKYARPDGKSLGAGLTWNGCTSQVGQILQIRLAGLSICYLCDDIIAGCGVLCTSSAEH